MNEIKPIGTGRVSLVYWWHNYFWKAEKPFERRLIALWNPQTSEVTLHRVDGDGIIERDSNIELRYPGPGERMTTILARMGGIVELKWYVDRDEMSAEERERHGY